MEKKTKKRQVLGVVGHEDVDYFVASNGTEFEGRDAEEKCKTYQSRLDQKRKWETIYKFSADFESLSSWQWCFAKNEEELDAIKYQFEYRGDKYANIFVNEIPKSELKGNELKVGEWIGLYYDSWDCGKDNIYIYTGSYTISQLKEYISRLEEKVE